MATDRRKIRSRDQQRASNDGANQHAEEMRLDSGMYVSVETFRLITSNLETGRHTLILGPTGIGKTRLAIEIARHLGRRVAVFPFGGFFDAEAALLGTTVFVDGETRFVPSRFLEALKTPGCVVVLDEINRAPMSALNYLLSLLDSQGQAAVDLAQGDARIVRLAPGVVILATMNHGSRYTGTEELDLALRNRFFYVRLGYPAHEATLLRELGLCEATACHVVKIAHAVREQHDEGALDVTVSVRDLLKVGDLLLRKFKIEESFLAALAAMDAETVAALRAIIRAVKP
jgi:nitric oxide reductase NorQ protein